MIVHLQFQYLFWSSSSSLLNSYVYACALVGETGGEFTTGT